MGYLSEQKYEARMKKIQEKNASIERKLKLEKEKDKHKKKFKWPSTSKLVLLVVFLLCLQIVIFCEYVMIVMGDTSALYVLIGIPATLVPTVISYYNKARAENTEHGIVYERTMYELNQPEHWSDGTDSSCEDAEG